MNKLFRVIDFPFRWICVGMIKFYQKCLSPLKPKCCKFVPTCSNYTLIAVKRFGALVGCFLGAKRIFRCNPKSKGGFDPVPDSIDEMRFVI